MVIHTAVLSRLRRLIGNDHLILVFLALFAGTLAGSAVVLFREPFTGWHVQAFVLIWCALAVYSVSSFRQDKARRRALRAASASATTVT